MAVASIDTHPQKKKLLDMLLSGESCRKVAEVAGISHTAVANYKRKVLKPALRTAVKLREIQPEQMDAVDAAQETAELTRAALHADPILARIAARDAARQRVMDAAEGKEDYRAWSALDRNDLAAVELHAKLTGRLDSARPAASHVTLVVLPQLPGATQQPARIEAQDVEFRALPEASPASALSTDKDK